MNKYYEHFTEADLEYSYDDDERDDYQERMIKRRIARNACSDRMCGALDCIKCHPEGYDWTEDDR